MKKIISLLLALCLISLLAFAVAEADFGGTIWYLTSLEQGGTALDPAALGMEVILTLNADGTCTMSGFGDDSTGTWSSDGEVITITEDGSQEQVFSINENSELVLDMGDGKMIFSTTAPEVSTPSVTFVAAESENAFFGTFKPVSINAMGMDMPPEMVFGEDIPVFTIEAGKVITTMGEGDKAQVEEEPAVFEDGLLNIFDPEGGETPVATVQMAEDGSIVLVLEQDGMTMMIITEKVEVAITD